MVKEPQPTKQDKEIKKEVKEETTNEQVVQVSKTKPEKPSYQKEAAGTALWKPKTNLGEKVKKGEISDIDEILDRGLKILEFEIVEALIPELKTGLLLIGQAKGKFGGGQRRVFKQTQKKTREGNKPKFATYGLVGNENGYIGLGYGKSKETVPAREKAFRKAKLNIFKIRRGCGDWACGCKEPHTIPFKVSGKCGSVEIILIPAPKGVGLKVEKECAKILKMAGIKDIWSRTKGKTSTKINLIKACEQALQKLITTKVKPEDFEKLGICDGRLTNKESEEEFMETMKVEETQNEVKVENA